MRGVRTALIALAAAGLLGAPAEAAAKEKKPKVTELLAGANELMAQAQSTYRDGQAKQALDLYRKALAEIDRLERENAALVGSSDFSPVRFRKAICETEIDRIMLEEVSATARTVAVTDTRALEEKREERKRAAETNHVPESVVTLTAKQGAEKVGDGAAPRAEAPTEVTREHDPNKPVDVPAELEWAKDMLSVDRFADAERSLVLVLKQAPGSREGRLLMALSRVQQGRFAEAAVVIDDLLADNPADEAALLLSAGASAGAGAYGKAMDALDRAMKADPKRPDGYHNMAWLLLDMSPKVTAEAEMYYRQAVKLGGARDRDIERRLGIRAE